ncbi:MAG: hypothetical protein MUF50_03050 [Planctomycetes bacterium]|jgi:hypothetical protein|nr:hypothetical protein [Planctomycetota bacterium]
MATKTTAKAETKAKVEILSRETVNITESIGLLKIPNIDPRNPQNHWKLQRFDNVVIDGQKTTYYRYDFGLPLGQKLQIFLHGIEDNSNNYEWKIIPLLGQMAKWRISVENKTVLINNQEKRTYTNVSLHFLGIKEDDDIATKLLTFRRPAGKGFLAKIEQSLLEEIYLDTQTPKHQNKAAVQEPFSGIKQMINWKAKNLSEKVETIEA